MVTGLDRKQLVERVACESDGRATNAVLTTRRIAADRESRELHAEAVRALVLDGLDNDDVDELARLTYAVLTRLDPQARYGITSDGITCSADPAPCPADPGPA